MCSSLIEQPYGWAFLPDLLLEEIFSQLPIKNLGRCSQVCLNWHRISEQDYAWRRFQYKDNMFTRRKYTSHAGWQQMIDHWKLRFLIVKATAKWKVLEIEPVPILFNLYEFIRVLINFSEYYERNLCEKPPLQGIRSFSFKWQLHVHVRGEDETDQVFGTGGEMLKTLSLLLSHLHGLTELSLQELQLESYECNDFIDDILYKFDSQLTSLCIINLTKIYRPLLQLGLFLFLEHLTISPQHLDESIVKLLADLRHLKSLTILQNEKTFGAKAVDSKAWLSFAERNNHTRIYLIQAGKRQNALIIQPGAPVYAIIFDKSTGQLTNELMQEVCYNYSTTLQFFLQKGLERRYRSREFTKRVDICAIELALRCPNLKLLAIRERMCFASALLLAQIARSHQMTICLRRNALLKRVNWTDHAVKKILDSENNQKWIKEHCKNFELLERTIQKITGTTAAIVTDNRYLIVMSDIADAHDFSITFLIGIIMIALPALSVIILCQFKKMEKKKQTQIVNETLHSTAKKKTAEQSMDVMNHTNAPDVEHLKPVEAMHKTRKIPLWTKTNQSIKYVIDSSLKTLKYKNRKGKNYQIIGDLDSTDTSYEYSLDNTLVMESLEMITLNDVVISKGKHDLALEGEEIDHQIGKTSQQSNSTDYSLFDFQSSRRDIRKQRLRLLRLNTTVASGPTS